MNNALFFGLILCYYVVDIKVRRRRHAAFVAEPRLDGEPG